MYYYIFDVKAEMCSPHVFILYCMSENVWSERYDSHAVPFFPHMFTQILKTAQQAAPNLSPLRPHKDETMLEVSGAQNAHSQNLLLSDWYDATLHSCCFRVPWHWVLFFFVNKLWSKYLSLHFLYHITGRFKQVVLVQLFSAVVTKLELCLMKGTECGLWFYSIYTDLISW